MTKKIVEFPAAKKEREAKENAFFEMHGYDIYKKIKFKTEKERKNFEKSMELAFDTYNEGLDGEKRLEKLNEAIRLSKYNIEARFMKISAQKISEFEKELEFQKLLKEVEDFEEGLYETGSGVINIFHYKVTEEVTDFYFFHKLHHKVIDFYKSYEKFDMKNPVFLNMHYKKLASYIHLQDWENIEKILVLAKKAKRHNDDEVLLAKVFYHLLEQREIDAAAFCKRLLDSNRYFVGMLDRMVSPELPPLETNSEEEFRRSMYFMENFSRFESLFNKEYFFDFFMNVREGSSLIADHLEKYAERGVVSLEEMSANPIFAGVSWDDLVTLREAGFTDELDFLTVCEEELLDEYEISEETVEKLDENGVEFRDEEEYDDWNWGDWED